MKGSLVKWIHDDEATNLCVILRAYLEDVDEDLEDHLQHDDNPMFLVYDFVTNELFYALLEELRFI